MPTVSIYPSKSAGGDKIIFAGFCIYLYLFALLCRLILYL